MERFAEKFLVAINLRIFAYASHVQPSRAGRYSLTRAPMANRRPRARKKETYARRGAEEMYHPETFGRNGHGRAIVQ